MHFSSISVDAVLAEASVQSLLAGCIVNSENACKAVFKLYNGAVEDAV